ncbi:MAG: amidohydrolase family protein [Bacteroidales bacterium]
MRKIDAHLHVGLGGLDADQLITYLDKHRIERCWLLTWEEEEAPIDMLYQHLSPEEVFAAYAKYPDRVVPFYAPDPKTDQLEQRIIRYKEHGLKGCGELKVTHQWEDQRLESYLKVIDRHQLPLLFHMEEPRMHYVPRKPDIFENTLNLLLNGALNGIVKNLLLRFSKKTSILKDHIEDHLTFFPGYLYDFAGLEKRLKQFPGQVFIAHGPHFWNNIASVRPGILFHEKGRIDQFGIIDRLLSCYDNLYCDISGKSGYNAMRRDPRKAKMFLEKHHRKILFGTDNTSYGHESLIRSLKLPSEKLENIFYRNADALIPA